MQRDQAALRFSWGWPKNSIGQRQGQAMRKFILTAAAFAAVTSFAATGAHAQAPPPPAVVPAIQPYMHVPWGLFVCPPLVMFSAAVAAVKDGRELTNWEAYSCGLLYWVGQPPKQYIRKTHHSELDVIEPRRVG
jgi:hypothetical protein